MSKFEQLIEVLRRGYEICAVCTKPFVAGTGVMVETKGMEELVPEDRAPEPFEVCSVECKNEYYRAGRE